MTKESILLCGATAIGVVIGFVGSYCYDHFGKFRNFIDYDEFDGVNEFDELGRRFTLPDGEIYVWKACRVKGANGESIPVYVKLLVPDSAKRVTPLNNNDEYKSRVACALVVEILDEQSNKYNEAEAFIRDRLHGMKYEVGKMVYAHHFDGDELVSCGAGINVHRYKNHCKQWFAFA